MSDCIAEPDEAEAAGTRERLMASALRAVVVHGYRRVGVAEILEQADGVSGEEFHRHFVSERECLLAACDALSLRVLDRVRRAYEEHEAWPAKVQGALTQLLNVLASQPRAARELSVELPASGQVPHRAYRAAIERYLPFLEEGREYSDLGDELPEKVAVLALGAAEAIVFDELSSDRAGALPELMPEILFAILVPYLGPAAAVEEMRAAAR